MKPTDRDGAPLASVDAEDACAEAEATPLGELAAWHSCNAPTCQGECEED